MPKSGKYLYAKFGFYLFTLIFHLYLLGRALLQSRYIIAAILLIPVTVVSLGMLKIYRKVK